MTKLTDAQVSTLTRGAQRPDGLISPAPGSKPHTALAMALKLEAPGLVERVACFHDDPWYANSAEVGEFYGYRVTAAGFDALGIDPSERPGYLAPLAIPEDMAPAFATIFTPPAEDDATLDARESAELASDYAAANASELPDEASEVEVVGTFIRTTTTVEGETAVEAQARLEASFPPVADEKPTLGAAADAVLAAWGLVLDGAVPGSGVVTALQPSMTKLATARAPKAAKEPKAPRVAGEVAAPRAGSKMETVIALVSRVEGVTIAQVQDATGWTATSARGFLSSLHIKRGLPVTSAKGADGVRVYTLATGPAAEEENAAA